MGCQDSSNYQLVVETADEAGAGTDADVGMIFWGDAGQSPEPGQRWDLNNSGDDRVKGVRDLYCIPMEAIGFVHTIDLWFDPTGQTDSPDWKCDWIELLNPSGQRINRWVINQWFREQRWYRFPTSSLISTPRTGKALPCVKKVPTLATAPPFAPPERI